LLITPVSNSFLCAFQGNLGVSQAGLLRRPGRPPGCLQQPLAAADQFAAEVSRQSSSAGEDNYKILVRSGERSGDAGTPLLQIDPLRQEAVVNSQEASGAAQEASLRYAKISLGTRKELFDTGVISKQELE